MRYHHERQGIYVKMHPHTIPINNGQHLYCICKKKGKWSSNLNFNMHLTRSTHTQAHFSRLKFSVLNIRLGHQITHISHLSDLAWLCSSVLISDQFKGNVCHFFFNIKILLSIPLQRAKTNLSKPFIGWLPIERKHWCFQNIALFEGATRHSQWPMTWVWGGAITNKLFSWMWI